MTNPAGPTPLEIINPHHLRGPFRCAVFDFDGTLSLLRGNWQGLMVPPMVEILAATGSGESRAALTAIVEEFVTRLTGQPTIVQMQALAEEVQKRGQPPPDPQVELARYLDRLLSQTAARVWAVEARQSTTDAMMVPGSRLLLETLAGRGWLVAIASGTELPHVQSESRVLKIHHFFGQRIFGPRDNNATFSKESVLRQLMAEHEMRGDEIVAIGDGPAEIRAAKAVGALALGVASDEIHQDGRVNKLKRDHLLRAGADAIIPDYQHLAPILRLLAPGP
jgi:phosphoglycolate phosphatase